MGDGARRSRGGRCVRRRARRSVSVRRRREHTAQSQHRASLATVGAAAPTASRGGVRAAGGQLFTCRQSRDQQRARRRARARDSGAERADRISRCQYSHSPSQRAFAVWRHTSHRAYSSPFRCVMADPRSTGGARHGDLAHSSDSDRSGGLRHSADRAARFVLLSRYAVRIDPSVGRRDETGPGRLVSSVGRRMPRRYGEQGGHGQRAARGDVV